MLSQKYIKSQIPYAYHQFDRYFQIPYIPIYIGSPSRVRQLRAKLVSELKCPNPLSDDQPYASAMETLCGENGCAILINQKYITEDDLHELHHMLYHEYGHCFAISHDQYLRPGRLSEDYWNAESFWQEFVAEILANKVDQEHVDIDKTLKYRLHLVFNTYASTVDTAALAMYFALALSENRFELIDNLSEDVRIHFLRMKRVLQNHLSQPDYWVCNSDLIQELEDCIEGIKEAKISWIIRNYQVGLIR